MEMEMKIGTTKSFTKFANKDPHRHIPFVECAPPSPGVTYWLACAVVIGTFAAAVYLEYLK